MRLTVTIKGELEDYINEQSEKTGFTKSMLIAMLAIQGMEYKQAVSVLAQFGESMKGGGQLPPG